ncbi:hypothetical protein K2X85_05255 [bacterium]|nr:hypothetical protein [bacterium]
MSSLPMESSKAYSITDFYLSTESYRNQTLAHYPNDLTIESWCYSFTSRSNLLAILSYHLGLPEKAEMFGREAIMASHEQLYGNWQERIPSGNYHDEPPSVEFWRKYNLWECTVSTGLLWSSALKQWRAMILFAEYVRDDVCLDPSQSKQERAWYIIVSGVCKGRDWKELLPWRTLIESSRQRKHRLLLACLEAMMVGDPVKAGNSMEEYIKIFKKTDFKSGDMSKVMSLDGSILLNLAKYKGWELPVSEIARPFLIEFSEEQLTRSCSENSNL